MSLPPPGKGCEKCGLTRRQGLRILEGMHMKSILEKLAQHALTVDQALAHIKALHEDNLGFARVDLHRHQRRGLPEVIFCPGKTAEQVIHIISSLKKAGQNSFATRADEKLYNAVQAAHPQAVYHHAARAITLDTAPLPRPTGSVVVISAGTADLPVAEEAALTATRMGARVHRVFDVGVAGLHRLMHHLDVLKKARAIVVVAGMEGALPSVIGGMVNRPIIAVPTSVGYGVNFGGITPLLAMLNTCVPGITVVNVDNGFGAGVAAALINQTGKTK